MATHLKRLRLDRIDFVDRGANPGAHIALFKRHTDNTTNDEESSMAEKKMTEAEQIADLTAKLAKAEADLAAAPKPAEKPEDIEKNLPEPVRALLEKARAEAKETGERIAKLEAERDRNQMIAKANEFKGLGAADDLTAILLPVSKAVPKDVYDALLAKMKGWNEIAKTSAIFKEVGSNAEGDQDPEVKLNVLAKAYHTAHPDLTPERAYSEVLKSSEGTALYRAAQAAKRGGK